MSFSASRALMAGLELGLIDHVASAPARADELAARLGLDPVGTWHWPKHWHRGAIWNGSARAIGWLAALGAGSIRKGQATSAI
jgi:hypothetical protein